jgi:hypothetical protein
MVVVQQNPDALRYVIHQTMEICMTAIKIQGVSYIHIKFQLFDHDEP